MIYAKEWILCSAAEGFKPPIIKKILAKRDGKLAEKAFTVL